jgi:RHS repeat-associated protein
VYTRDASGNVLSVYSKAAAGTLQQTENHLYGSSRLGMITQHTAPDTSVLLATGFGYARKSLFIRGAKLFELSNHLGNVLVTVTDRRQQSSGAGVNVDYYQADVAGANDYYPGGMQMPGRQYSATTGYRYGFNGKEKDTEGPVQYDYGFRIYDPRLVRFKSVDPLTAKYPWLTPYQYASNSPIALIDIDGAEGGVPPKENAVINVFLYPSDMFNGTDKDIAQIPGYLQAKAQQDVGNNIRALQVASKTDAYNQIFQLKSQGYIIGNLVIESHGEHGTSFSIGSDEFKTGTEPELKAITDGMIGHIVLMGCEVGMNKELITNLANSTGQSVYAHQGWTSDWPGMFNDPDVSPQFLRPVVEYLYNNNDEFRTEVRSKAPWILRWAISDETFINRATNSIIEQGVSPSGSADIWANEYHPDFVDPATGQSKRNTYETRVGVWALASPEIGYNIIVPGALKFTPSGGIEWTPKSFYDTYWGQIYKKAVEARYNTTINPSSNEP